MKKTITKEEYVSVVGLMVLARKAYRRIQDCKKAYKEIVDEKEEFGHFSDEIFNDGDIDRALRNEGIKVKNKTNDKNNT